MKVKFQQIAPVMNGDGIVSVWALDDAGSIWVKADYNGEWRQIVAPNTSNMTDEEVAEQKRNTPSAYKPIQRRD